MNVQLVTYNEDLDVEGLLATVSFDPEIVGCFYHGRVFYLVVTDVGAGLA